jgi:hypothetical protein
LNFNLRQCIEEILDGDEEGGEAVGGGAENV